MKRAKVIALLWLAYRLRKRRERKRRFWVHPINLRRENEDVFRKLFEDLKNDEGNFFNYFQMSSASFDELEEKFTSRHILCVKFPSL